MLKQDVIKAALCAYQDANTFPYWDDGERVAARSAVRNVIAHLGLYGEFLEALEITPTAKLRGNHADLS